MSWVYNKGAFRATKIFLGGYIAMYAHVEDCIFITSRILTSHKNGKQFCILSFLHDGVLYSDVFLDEKFIPDLTCLTYNDKFSIDFIIQRFNGNWKVSVDSITI